MDGVRRVLLVLAVFGAACGQKEGGSRSPHQYPHYGSRSLDPVVESILDRIRCRSHGQHGRGAGQGRQRLHYHSGNRLGRATCGSTEWHYTRCSGGSGSVQGSLELTSSSGHQPSRFPWHAGMSTTGDLIFIQKDGTGNGLNVTLSFCPGPGAPGHGAPARFEQSRPHFGYGGQNCHGTGQVSHAWVSFDPRGGGRRRTVFFGPLPPCRGGRF